MDERLEKIRYFKANVKDFDTYINDRIRDTEKENISESVSENTYEQYGLTPTDAVPADCLNYIITNIYNFDRRYDLALDKIGRLRIPLEHADTNLFDEILELAYEWQNEYAKDTEEITHEDIEEIFG